MKSLTLLGPFLLALTSVNATPMNPVAEATVPTATVRAPTPTTGLSARQESIVCAVVYFPITSTGASPGADCGGYQEPECNLAVSHVTIRTLRSGIFIDVNPV
jgi:hypothetical protein